MSAAKHTRGPWEVQQFAGRFNVWPAHRKSDGTAVAYDIAEADAPLIAAAPDLLEKLKSIVECWQVEGLVTDAHLGAALDTIAKAQGGAS